MDTSKKFIGLTSIEACFRQKQEYSKGGLFNVHQESSLKSNNYYLLPACNKTFKLFSFLDLVE